MFALPDGSMRTTLAIMEEENLHFPFCVENHYNIIRKVSFPTFLCRKLLYQMQMSLNSILCGKSLQHHQERIFSVFAFHSE
jgi:hypothetical protein